VQETLTASLGRAPSIEEIASTLGVDRQSATDALADASRTVAALDETNADLLIADNATPEETVMTAERTVFVRSSVAALPEDMRYIIEQVYFEERSVKDIAEELGFTHSAVSQKRAEAVRLIRDGLSTHYAEEDERPASAESRIAPVRRAAYLARVAEYAKAGMVADLADSGWQESAVS
jgi:RNA polymerase sigma factor for flagellar operon FliA